MKTMESVLSLLVMTGVLWLLAAGGEGSRAACTQSTDPCVLTYHNNNMRDGVNPNELILTPSNIVNTKTRRQFGRLFTTVNLDGEIYAQPLFMYNVTINGVAHRNAVFVATEGDSVYAFDAASETGSTPDPLWQKLLLHQDEVPVPDSDLPRACTNINPRVGVTGTPVMDVSKGVLYLVSKTKNTKDGSFHQWLNAVNVANGLPRYGGRVEITSPGFDPLAQNQRAGLALGPNGHVYIAWASHCDGGSYHGWVMEYMVNSMNALQQVNVFNETPQGSAGGIWQAGGAPALDASGNLFLSTGNGTFDAPAIVPGQDPGPDYGSSVLKLSSALAVGDAFTPQDEKVINNKQNDLDLGSGGVVLINTTNPPELVAAGKDQHIYVMNQTNLGGFEGYNDDCISMRCNANILQDLPNVLQRLCPGGDPGNWATPAFFDNKLYVVGSEDKLRAFSLNTATGKFEETPVLVSGRTFCYPGATPSISANGTSYGIVWVLDSTKYGNPPTKTAGPAVLYAYDAEATGMNASALFASNRNVSDQAPNAVKFVPPTIGNGKVFVAGGGSTSGTGTLAVYGLCPCATN
jgi:hypothetical protein